MLAHVTTKECPNWVKSFNKSVPRYDEIRLKPIQPVIENIQSTPIYSYFFLFEMVLGFLIDMGKGYPMLSCPFREREIL